MPNKKYPLQFRLKVTSEVRRRTKALLTDLETQARQGPSWSVGEQALAALALLKSGVPPDAPAIAEVIAKIRQMEPRETYAVSVGAMALTAQYEPSRDAFETERIDASGMPIVPPLLRSPAEIDRAWLRRAVSFLVDRQRAWRDRRIRRVTGDTKRPSPPRGHQGSAPADVFPDKPAGWGYPGGPATGNKDFIDVSNTQYALLGLKASARCGIPVPESVWRSALVLLLSWQRRTGRATRLRGNEVRGDRRIEWVERAERRGFAYGSYTGTTRDDLHVTGSLTAAGLSSLMICQSELWESPQFTDTMKERTRVAVRDGLAWLQKNFSMQRNPGRSETTINRGADVWFTSYLYAMERLGVLGHIRFIGKRDWYADGVGVLLERRPSARRTYYDASFELLFLRRASFRSGNPVVTPR